MMTPCGRTHDLLMPEDFDTYCTHCQVAMRERGDWLASLVAKLSRERNFAINRVDRLSGRMGRFKSERDRARALLREILADGSVVAAMGEGSDLLGRIRRDLGQ